MSLGKIQGYLRKNLPESALVAVNNLMETDLKQSRDRVHSWLCSMKVAIQALREAKDEVSLEKMRLLSPEAFEDMAPVASGKSLAQQMRDQ